MFAECSRPNSEGRVRQLNSTVKLEGIEFRTVESSGEVARPAERDESMRRSGTLCAWIYLTEEYSVDFYFLRFHMLYICMSFFQF